MARYTTSVRSDMAPTEAFDLIADLANLENWDPGVSSSVQVQGQEPGPEAEYDVTLSTASMKLRYVTTEFTGPRAVTYEAETRFFTSIDVISVEADKAGSIVTYDATLQLPLVLRMADPLLRIVFRRVGDNAADGLRDILDGQFVS